MRFVSIYLTGYFALILGALLALWYGGVLRQIPPAWILIALVIAIGLGVTLAVTAVKREIQQD